MHSGNERQQEHINGKKLRTVVVCIMLDARRLFVDFDGQDKNIFKTRTFISLLKLSLGVWVTGPSKVESRGCANTNLINTGIGRFSEGPCDFAAQSTALYKSESTKTVQKKSRLLWLFFRSWAQQIFDRLQTNKTASHLCFFLVLDTLQ